MNQNRSMAVMQYRATSKQSLDLFPTPPWATRALCEWLCGETELSRLSAWEPACGLGDMVKPLREFFGRVIASDIKQYGCAEFVEDFLWPSDRGADWIITNPPFTLAAHFAATAVRRSEAGAALLVRTAFLEGKARLETLFRPCPPSDVLQFSERVPMRAGRLDGTGSTATAYCWVVWRKGGAPTITRLHWIAPCRKRLERPGDYPVEIVDA